MAANINLPARVIRYGVDEPLLERTQLKAGPITAVIEGSNLRYIRVGEHEIVRGIYMAVRDRNWDTPEPRFLSYEVYRREGEFVVRFRAEHVERDVDFVWDGTISGTSDGVITYSMDGEVRRTFWRGRIGICLLHPMSLAGVPVEVRQPGGTLVKGEFPVHISPHQPFLDMEAMGYEVGSGIWVDTRFEGDLFEMEDQRNWTDASYKTYSTPLRLSYPVEVKAGERIKQTITITVSGGGTVAKLSSGSPEVRVTAEEVAKLPGLGIGTASHGRPLEAAQLEALKCLSLEHLWHEAHLLEPTWEARLRQAVGEARALGVPLELAAVTDAGATNLHRLIQTIATEGLPVARLRVFDRAKHTTTRQLAARTRELLTAARLQIPFGGGSRAYYAEFGRADLPLELLEFVGWGISPQVHTFDNSSLVETLQAEAVTVQSGRAKAASLPLRIGPITLKPRFNPNATGPAAEPSPSDLPPEVDPRQMSLFAAAWVVGSMRYLAASGVASATYFETTGPRGVLDDGRAERIEGFRAPVGAAYPVYHIFADLGEFAGASVLAVNTNDPLAVEALGLRSGSRVRILVANMTGDGQRTIVSLPRLERVKMRLLTEATAEQAMVEPAEFRQRVDGQFESCLEQLELELAPYAVAKLDGTLTLGTS